MNANQSPFHHHLRPRLVFYAWLVVAAIFVLVVMGGNVTSTNAGMAFEDWPTSAGHNIFLTPLDVWWQAQDKFAEHSHRLMGTFVGALSIGLAVWLWIVRYRAGKAWQALAWIGTALLAMVIVQGLMGGFRVTEVSRFLAFLHGIFGQFVLAIAVVAASLTTWKSKHESASDQPNLLKVNTASAAHVRRFAWTIVAMFVVQLILGAGVRHSGSAVAIPDFPTSYGHLIPPMSERSLNSAQAAIGTSANPQSPGHYELWQVWLHFAHRLGAIGVCLVTALGLWKLFQKLDWAEELFAPTIMIASLIVIQIILGITTVLSKERPSVATLHQTVGAALLASVTWLTVRVYFARFRLAVDD